MTPLFRKFLGLNWVIFFTMLGLLIFGVFAVYSASWMRDGDYLPNSFNRQITWILVGLVAFFATSLIDYRWIRWAAIPAYILGIGCLLALRIKGATKSGATSWLEVGGISFQPSQLAIVSGIIVLAVVLGELHRLHPVFENHLLRLCISGGFVVVPFVLIVLEPDVGSAFVWVPVVAAMFLVASIPFRYLTLITLVGLIGLPLVYWFVLRPYQKERIDTYIGMLTGSEVDEAGAAWDPKHCMIAVATGGWEGKGFKGNRIKRIDPERKTINEMGFISPRVIINDYIFAVIAEQHGFRGSMVMITAFALLLLQCLFVAFCSRDQMGRLVVMGVVALLFIHIFMNVGMTILLVPVTGLPLPFISYGGTFVVICMFLLGLVQSVWVHRNVEENLPDRSFFYSTRP